MRFALLLGLVFQAFIINDVAAQSTTPSPTVHGGHRLEVFGGYSYLHFDSGFSSAQVPATSMGMNGWIAGGTYNVTNYLGVTAEFSGQYAGDLFGVNTFFSPPFSTHVHNFLFGPTLTYRKNTKITPFAHILVGDSRATIINNSPGFNATRDTFALGVGGGVDYRISRRLAVRFGQFDYLHTSFNLTPSIAGLPTSQNHFRYSAGIVIKAF